MMDQFICPVSSKHEASRTQDGDILICGICTRVHSPCLPVSLYWLETSKDLTKTSNSVHKDRVVDIIEGMYRYAIAIGESLSLEARSQLSNRLIALRCGPETLWIEGIDVQRLVLVELRLIEIVRQYVLSRNSEHVSVSANCSKQAEDRPTKSVPRRGTASSIRNNFSDRWQLFEEQSMAASPCSDVHFASPG